MKTLTPTTAHSSEAIPSMCDEKQAHVWQISALRPGVSFIIGHRGEVGHEP